jgi:glycosyltransferase involved in cell wall biosynthesis
LPEAQVAGFERVEHRLGILVVGDESVASTRYRILAHLPALRAAGFRTSVATQRPRPENRLLRLPLRLADEIRDLRRVAASDLVLIHRRCYPPIMTPMLQRRDRPMIFDIDDALYLPSPTERQSSRVRRRYRRNFNATAEAARTVLCGNAELSDKVPHPRTAIVPTAVDCDRFRPEAGAPVDGLTAGWVGHSSNLGFLETIAGPLREIARRHAGFKLVVVADRRPRIDGVPMEFRRWSLDGEVDVFRGMGIGLMPLDDTPWTRAKCAFKLLQYMALGIPSVASPVGMNREVVEDGLNGLLAGNEGDWVSCLDQLIQQPELRQRLGRAGRATVLQRYSLPEISSRVVSLLQRLLAKTRSSTEKG